MTFIKISIASFTISLYRTMFHVNHIFMQNHVPVETCLKLLYDDRKVISHMYDIRNGFYHYCALTERSYDFSCVLCGDFPKVVVGDGNWKNTCSLTGLYIMGRRNISQCWIKFYHYAISLEEESLQNSTEQLKDEVNVEELWKCYEKEVIGRGFFGKCWWPVLVGDGNSSTSWSLWAYHDHFVGCRLNPWNVPIRFNTVAPWMGASSRKSCCLPNTEHRKISILNCPTHVKLPGSHDLSHEDILKALENADQVCSFNCSKEHFVSVTFMQ